MKRQPFSPSLRGSRSGADAPRPRAGVLRPATLRGKTMLIIGATVLGLLLVLAVPVRLVVLGGFLSLEEQDTRRNVQRAANALTNDMNSLARTAASYSVWDATYNYVAGSNPTYIADNLADSAFSAASLNLALIFDDTNQIVFSKAYDLISDQEVPVPQELVQTPSPLEPLLATRQTLQNITGILMLPQGPMLLAVTPILPNSGVGPANGTTVWGRYLNDAMMQRLAETTQLTMHVTPINGADVHPDVRAALLAGTDTVVQPLDENTVAGVTLLRGVQGQPDFLLRIEMPRAIYAQGQASTRYFTLSLLVACLVFSLVILLLLQRSVLQRLTRLSDETTRVGTHANLSERVTLGGRDELAQLAFSINGMLAALERTQDERHMAEEDRAQLQEAFIRSREQIIHLTIHDLKTPLSVIIGYLDMLKMTLLDEEQRDYVTYARRGSTNMLHLVQDVLDTARMQEGQLVVRRALFDVQSLFETCANDLSNWAMQAEQRVSLSVRRDLPALFLDAQLTRRVIVNLLSNAIKHTPPGTSIVLGAEVTGESLLLWVWDDGPGIPQELQETMFAPFKASPSMATQQNNTGLGLTFCTLAVEAHGGTLGVCSAAGQGTTITITLPLASSTQPRSAVVAASEAKPLYADYSV